MKTRRFTPARRWLMALALGASLPGCAVYAPPYAAYEPAPAGAPYYYYPYAYGGPVYVGPPLSLHFGYEARSYRGYRGYGGYRGWHGGGYRGGWGGRR